LGDADLVDKLGLRRGSAAHGPIQWQGGRFKKPTISCRTKANLVLFFRNRVWIAVTLGRAPTLLAQKKRSGGDSQRLRSETPRDRLRNTRPVGGLVPKPTLELPSCTAKSVNNQTCGSLQCRGRRSKKVA
jgi:hypothetical protein